MTENPVDRGVVVYYAARAAHEAVRSWCLLHTDTTLPPPWDGERALDMLMGTAARTSAVAGVEGVLAGHGPEAQHEAWMRHRIANGWIWGPEKDSGKKTHPNLVPYAELSDAQKTKDQIFIGVARVMLQAAGIACPTCGRDGNPYGSSGFHVQHLLCHGGNCGRLATHACRAHPGQRYCDVHENSGCCDPTPKESA